MDALLAPREPRVGERRRREHPGARAQRLPEERREPRLVGGAEQQHVRQDDGRAAPPRDRRRAEQVALDELDGRLFARAQLVQRPPGLPAARVRARRVRVRGAVRARPRAGLRAEGAAGERRLRGDVALERRRGDARERVPQAPAAQDRRDRGLGRGGIERRAAGSPARGQGTCRIATAAS